MTDGQSECCEANDRDANLLDLECPTCKCRNVRYCALNLYPYGGIEGFRIVCFSCGMQTKKMQDCLRNAVQDWRNGMIEKSPWWNQTSDERNKETEQ